MKEILPFVTTWMDPYTITLSKICQAEKDKYHMMSFICGIYNATQMNLQTEQKQTHRYREETCGCPGKEGFGDGWTGSWD